MKELRVEVSVGGHDIAFEPIVLRQVCVGPGRIGLRVLLVLQRIDALWVRRESFR